MQGDVTMSGGVPGPCRVSPAETDPGQPNHVGTDVVISLRY